MGLIDAQPSAHADERAVPTQSGPSSLELCSIFTAKVRPRFEVNQVHDAEHD